MRRSNLVPGLQFAKGVCSSGASLRMLCHASWTCASPYAGVQHSSQCLIVSCLAGIMAFKRRLLEDCAFSRSTHSCQDLARCPITGMIPFVIVHNQQSSEAYSVEAAVLVVCQALQHWGVCVDVSARNSSQCSHE